MLQGVRHLLHIARAAAAAEMSKSLNDNAHGSGSPAARVFL